jgi:signal transduction histidine kinase
MNRVAPQPGASNWLAPYPFAVQSVAVLALLATAFSVLRLDMTPGALWLLTGLCTLHLLAVLLVPARRLPRWAQLLYLISQGLLAGVVQVSAPAAPLAYVYLAIVLQAIVLLPLWFWVPFAVLLYTVWSGLLLIATTSVLAWLQDNLALVFPATCAIIAMIVYMRQQRRDEQVQQMLAQMQQRYDQLAAGMRELQQRTMLEERQRLAQTIVGEVQMALGRAEQSVSAALNSAQSNLSRLQSTVAQTRLATAQTVERLRGAIATLRRGESPTPPELSMPHPNDEDVLAARFSKVLTWVLPSVFVLLAIVLTLIQHGLVMPMLALLLGCSALLLLAYVATQYTRRPLLLRAGLIGQTMLLLAMTLLTQTPPLLLGLLLVLWQLLVRLPLSQGLPFLIGLPVAIIALLSRLNPMILNTETLLVGMVAAVAVGSPLLLARRRLDRRKQAELRLALLGAEIEQQTTEVQTLAVAAERSRLAREVHDDLGSRLMLINLQLQMAEELADEDAGAALEQLERSREQLHAAWRAVLAVADAELPLGHEDLALALGGLVAPLGDLVRLRLDGELELLPAPLAATVYRTVQEGLTNARRHACPTQINVQVIAVCGYVTVTVSNDTAPESDPSCGKGMQVGSFGLLGLRERAEALGGGLEAGPNAEGGWRLRVVLPAEGI